MKKTMNESAPLTGAKKHPPAKLFLETSAQFLRLQGQQPELKRQIVELIEDAQKSGSVIGTSAHVKREFDYVYAGFFKEVEGRIASLPDPTRQRQFDELWSEVLGLMPPFYPGGHRLLEGLTITFMGKYAGRRVPPTFIQNIVTLIKADLKGGFFNGTIFFDNSSCEVWETRGSCSKCDPDPDHECRLRNTSVANRANFLASATTMAGARRTESKWFKKNLERLQGAEGKALHALLGKNPNAVGDLVIFWEVPDGWTILSRDRTFQILAATHRKEVGFYLVRLPRRNSNQPCKVRAASAGGEVDGTLINYNAKGARFRAENFRATEGQGVLLTAKQLGIERYGEISKMDPLLPDTFGVKFKLKRLAS
jgi:hypothetical protein